MLTLLHASDLQIGRPFRPWAAEALLRLADRIRPDLVVVAGDLTQRAKAGEFRVARDLLARFDRVPIVVTPGNHDVPLYRAWERLVSPYRNWRRFISPELDSVTRGPGVTVVALNSSAPRRAIVGGRLSARQVSYATTAFADTPAADLRLVVTHHHFVPTVDREGGRPLPRAGALLEAFEELGVDAVLGGHVHHTHVRTSKDLGSGRAGVALIACGTTTSRRGRGVEAGLNSLNVVRLGEEKIEVIPYRLVDASADFEAGEAIAIPRWRAESGRPTSSGGPR